METKKLKSLDNKDDVSSSDSSGDSSRDNHHWSAGTCAIIGDSILTGMEDNRFQNIGPKVKIFDHSSATIDDLHHHIIPILKRKPDHIIIHVVTNDAVSKTSRQILDDLLQLKNEILKTLPNCNVIISKPTMRVDNGKTALTLKHLNEHLSQLKVDSIDNSNIKSMHIGRKGLHLNNKGKDKLALNFFHKIRNFRRFADHLNEPSELSHSQINSHITLKDKVKDSSTFNKTCNNSAKSERPIFSPKHISSVDANEGNDKSPESSITFDSLSDLQQIRINNPLRLIIGQIIINSIRNKFDALMNQIKDNIDILMISETKIDDTFPEIQFCFPRFSKPFRLEKTCNGGGILLFIREDIPSKLIKTKFLPKNFEGFFVEINLRRKKWLLCCSYNSHKNKISSHLDIISKSLDDFSTTYDNLMLLGDFNVEPEEKHMVDFLNVYNLKNLVHQKTCFKNPDNPTCIDLILTNSPRSFQNTNVFETGLSDFRKLTTTVLKMHFPKKKPNIVVHRDFIKIP